jgi:hypothetical protein
MSAKDRRVSTRIHRGTPRRCLAVPAVVLGLAGAAALGLPAVAGATSSNLSWSGAGAASNWSVAGNWSGTAPIAGGDYGTLTLGALSKACSRLTDFNACYNANNDLGQLTVDAIDVNGASPYFLQGDGITLGAGGIDVTPPGQRSGEPRLETPLTLAADQTWTVNGAGSRDPGVLVVGPVNGSSSSLTINLSGEDEVGLQNNVDVGPLTLSGQGTTYMTGSLNGISDNPVTVTDLSQLAAEVDPQQSGPLAVTDGGGVSVGEGQAPDGTLQVNGAASFTSPSSLHLYLDSRGTGGGNNSDPKAASDYSQLTAAGNVSLGGATLKLAQGMLANFTCGDLHTGDVYTLVSTSGGTISGTFAGVANGHDVKLGDVCDRTTDPAVVRINYTPTSVTATVVNGGGAGDLPTAKGSPRISGKTVVGQTLHVSKVSWTHKPTSYKYDWIACPARASCKQIKTRKPSLLLTRSLIGRQLVVVVTATNKYGQGQAQSNFTGTVKAAPKRK